MKNMYNFFSILFLTLPLFVQTGYREYQNRPICPEALALQNINQRAIDLKTAIDQSVPLLQKLCAQAQCTRLNFVTIQKIHANITTRIGKLKNVQKELQSIKQPLHLQPDQQQHIKKAQEATDNGSVVLNKLAEQEKQINDTNKRELRKLFQQSGIALPLPSDQGLTSLGVDKNTAIVFNNFFFLIAAASELARISGEKAKDIHTKLFASLSNLDKTAFKNAIKAYAHHSTTLDKDCLVHEFEKLIDTVFDMLTHIQPGTLLTEEECTKVVLRLPELGLQLDPKDFDQNAEDIYFTLQEQGLGEKFRILPPNIKLFYYYLVQTIRFYTNTRLRS